MPARFHEIDIKSGLKDRRKLSAFLDTLVYKHRKKVKRVSQTYIFCSDEYLLQMNQQFLDHDTFTDIITFDISEDDTELVGEIYISADRVKENAAKFGVAYVNELHRVIFHGALHLCGFKDKKKEDKEMMRTQEDKCLKEYSKQNKALV
jgi:probable rRNA maturation factor